MALALFTLLAALAAEAPDASVAPGKVIDRVIAVVNQQPILLSELEFEVRVMLVSKGGLEAASAPVSDETLAAVLEQTIIERLAVAEADRLQAIDVSEAEVEKDLKAFEGHFKTDKQLAAFLESQEATRDDLAAVLRRMRRANKFLFEQSRSTHAEASALQPRVKRQIDDLRAKADIRIVFPLGSDAGVRQ
jgi:hypothetical protein